MKNYLCIQHIYWCRCCHFKCLFPQPLISTEVAWPQWKNVSSPIIRECITCEISESEPSNDMCSKSSSTFIDSSWLSVCLFVCPSFRPHGTIRLPLDRFSRNLMFRYFSKICSENSSFIKIWQEQWVLYIKDQYKYMIISSSVILRVRNISDKCCRENPNTHFTFINFFVENRVVYEIMWTNVVEPNKPQMAIWRMRIACWIPRLQHILRKVTQCFSTAKMVARTLLTAALYVHYLSLIIARVVPSLDILVIVMSFFRQSTDRKYR
jgi:hypothetical protein